MEVQSKYVKEYDAMRYDLLGIDNVIRLWDRGLLDDKTAMDCVMKIMWSVKNIERDLQYNQNPNIPPTQP
jgi:hypothetical protein